MQKWEYLDIAISKSRHQWFVDGKEVEGANVTRAAILNTYGAAGWELVAVTHWQGAAGVGHTYYFKRPLAGERDSDVAGENAAG